MLSLLENSISSSSLLEPQQHCQTDIQTRDCGSSQAWSSDGWKENSSFSSQDSCHDSMTVTQQDRDPRKTSGITMNLNLTHFDSYSCLTIFRSRLLYRFFSLHCSLKFIWASCCCCYSCLVGRQCHLQCLKVQWWVHIDRLGYRFGWLKTW